MSDLTIGGRVLVDACILIPGYLRTLLLDTAEYGLFEIAWSAEILNEIQRNLIELGLATGPKADRLIMTMRREFPDATVEKYEALTPLMTNHPKDRHVLAAAVKGGARIIVTENIRDFPQSSLTPYGLRVIRVDAFLCHLLSADLTAIRTIIDRQVDRFTRPELTHLELLDRLAIYAPAFVERLRSRGWW